jgi:cGMP-dependent 3',5'-cyclic phosphodiesterase
VNIKDAYHHPLFYAGCDQETGFKTRNILCFPICDEEGVIGVAELCNKMSHSHFTTVRARGLGKEERNLTC